jgi:hypothetical protein
MTFGGGRNKPAHSNSAGAGSRARAQLAPIPWCQGTAWHAKVLLGHGLRLPPGNTRLSGPAAEAAAAAALSPSGFNPAPPLVLHCRLPRSPSTPPPSSMACGATAGRSGVSAAGCCMHSASPYMAAGGADLCSIPRLLTARSPILALPAGAARILLAFGVLYGILTGYLTGLLFAAQGIRQDNYRCAGCRFRPRPHTPFCCAITRLEEHPESLWAHCRICCYCWPLMSCAHRPAHRRRLPPPPALPQRHQRKVLWRL